MPDVTAIVGTPTPTPKRPRLYLILESVATCDGPWWNVLNGGEVYDHAQSLEGLGLQPGSVPITIPGEDELSENGKPAMTDRESLCIVCGGRLAKDNFCGKCGVRTRPATSMSPRERRLVEKVKDLLANSTEEDDVEADEYGAMIRGKWREVRSALAAYDAPTP